jgi:cytochrome b
MSRIGRLLTDNPAALGRSNDRSTLTRDAQLCIVGRAGISRIDLQSPLTGNCANSLRTFTDGSGCAALLILLRINAIVNEGNVMTADTTKQVRVWDVFVRVAHWAIVAGFFVAYFTEDELLPIHVWAGYIVGAIVILRVIWGFAGPEYARFSNFVYSPAKVFGYLAGLFRRSVARYLGHSPAGGAMVILLLISLGATVWSGLTVYAYDEGAGPLAEVLVGEAARGSASVNEREDGSQGRGTESAFEAQEEYWEELHEFCANLTLVLVAFHIAGVLLASFVHRENLPWSMVSGYKRAPDE